MSRLPIVDFKTIEKVLFRLVLRPSGKKAAIAFTGILTGEPRRCRTMPDVIWRGL